MTIGYLWDEWLLHAAAAPSMQFVAGESAAFAVRSSLVTRLCKTYAVRH